jgi:hypothetical protein
MQSPATEGQNGAWHKPDRIRGQRCPSRDQSSLLNWTAMKEGKLVHGCVGTRQKWRRPDISLVMADLTISTRAGR